MNLAARRFVSAWFQFNMYVNVGISSLPSWSWTLDVSSGEYETRVDYCEQVETSCGYL